MPIFLSLFFLCLLPIPDAAAAPDSFMLAAQNTLVAYVRRAHQDRPFKRNLERCTTPPTQSMQMQMQEMIAHIPRTESQNTCVFDTFITCLYFFNRYKPLTEKEIDALGILFSCMLPEELQDKPVVFHSLDVNSDSDARKRGLVGLQKDGKWRVSNYYQLTQFPGEEVRKPTHKNEWSELDAGTKLLFDPFPPQNPLMIDCNGLMGESGLLAARGPDLWTLFLVVAGEVHYPHTLHLYDPSPNHKLFTCRCAKKRISCVFSPINITIHMPDSRLILKDEHQPRPQTVCQSNKNNLFTLTDLSGDFAAIPKNACHFFLEDFLEENPLRTMLQKLRREEEEKRREEEEERQKADKEKEKERQEKEERIKKKRREEEQKRQKAEKERLSNAKELQKRNQQAHEAFYLTPPETRNDLPETEEAKQRKQQQDEYEQNVVSEWGRRRLAVQDGSLAKKGGWGTLMPPQKKKRKEKAR